MGIYLTNGTCYITHNKSGAVTKVSDIKDAQNFYTVERAIEQKKKASGKCAGYYHVEIETDGFLTAASSKNRMRKKFSVQDRLVIYGKTEGHCYLCGGFIDFDKFEIEHREPLAKGGTNDFSNLWCSCHTCNTLKGSIAPSDLLEKIKQIHLYQFKQAHANGIKWRIVYKVLEKIL